MTSSMQNHQLPSHGTWSSTDPLLVGLGSALPDNRALSRQAADRHAVSQALAQRRVAVQPKQRSRFFTRRRVRAAATETV